MPGASDADAAVAASKAAYSFSNAFELCLGDALGLSDAGESTAGSMEPPREHTGSFRPYGGSTSASSSGADPMPPLSSGDNATDDRDCERLCSRAIRSASGTIGDACTNMLLHCRDAPTPA
jgi:hypothetical protein